MTKFMESKAMTDRTAGLRTLSALSALCGLAVSLAVGCAGGGTGTGSVEPPSPQPSGPPSVAIGSGASHSPSLVSRSSIRFIDIAAAAGLTEPFFNAADGRFRLVETMGAGAGFLDFDRDGRMDVYVLQGSLLPADPQQTRYSAKLYRNEGDGKFADVTERARAGFRGYGQGVAVGDYDGDGWEDFYVSAFGGGALFRNRGDGSFEDATERSGLKDRGWGTSCAFADLDGDGDLDLFIAHYLADTVDAQGEPTARCDAVEGRRGYCPPYAHQPESDVLFRNNGDGTFSDVSRESGIAKIAANGLGVAVADLDDDGRLDLFVANDQMANALYRNLGGLRFEEKAIDWGVAYNEAGRALSGMGIAAGDYDGDGRTDLFVTNFLQETNTLFRNVAPEVFEVATPSARLSAPSRSKLGFGTGFQDFDNDGALDLFVANGHINDVRSLGLPYRMRPQIFRNAGSGKFVEAVEGAGPYFQGEWLGRSAAFGDFDDDGGVDVLVTHLDRPPALLRNQTPDRGHWLTLTLKSGKLGRAVVGARVEVVAGGTRLVRERIGGSSYLCANDPRLHFGLGRAAKIDRVEVRWPSGRRQSFEGPDFEADCGWELAEGANPIRLSR